MSVSTVRDGLKSNLATISGLATYDTVPDKPETPCAIVMPSSNPFIMRETMAKGVMSLYFTVTVLVGRGSIDDAQDRLDAYVQPYGTGSVWVALESDKTAGGAAADLHVESVNNYGDVVFNDIAYLAAEFAVRVLATT